MKIIKYLINRTSQKLGIPFYTKSQTYKISYEVKITNLFDQTQEIVVIAPVFQNMSSQMLMIDNQFNIKSEIKREKKFGNKYAVWQDKLAPKQAKELKEQARILVDPVRIDMKQDFHMSEYNKNQEEYQKYIKSDAFLDSGIPEIQKIGDNIIKAEKSVLKGAEKLYNYVIKLLNYGDAYLGLYTAKDALERDKCDCGGFSSLLGALYKSAGIPARIVSGFWAGHNHNNMHAWLEFMLPDMQWIQVDPAIEHLARRGRTNKLGVFGVIGSDRIIVSKGQDMQLDINGWVMNIDILQNPIIIAEQGRDSYDLKFEFSAIREVK